MSDELKVLESMVAGALAQESNPTQKSIRELISSLRKLPMFGSVSETAAEHLARQFEERRGVTMTLGSMLTDKGFEPWLDEAKNDIDPYYWNRYKLLLIGKGFASGPNGVIEKLDEVTDKILGHLGNPREDSPWDRRGMVVGHVQSGKTANYTGLICKASDAGYKLIVVIAGIHNNLRNQTQRRIDEGFVGRDSSRLFSNREERSVGVGKFDQTRRPTTFTTSIKDFNKATASGIGVPLQNLIEPALFVIKKNSSTLKNLLEWLKEHSAKGSSRTISAPMLLIDDEADNASINIRHDKDEVSRINGQIRELLRMFEKSCYIGYTATPFANIFIDPDSDDEMRGADLFPRNFIVSLDPPSNYFGATKVFLNESNSIVRHIEDNEDYLPLRHDINTELVTLPPSLLTAIRIFVVARAIRLVRGHATQHCSMLVNASRFTGVQAQLRNVIHRRLESIQASVRVNGAMSPRQALQDPEIFALHSVWQAEFAASSKCEWIDVQKLLHDAASSIRVVEVNSRSSGTLNYSEYEKSGLNVIAVGGFSLSRGLTLEGLMVSYFLRNSMMYDTLMQMGRWFGYRPGYEDLCRVWMPEDAEGWYAHIAESIEELREELRSMEAAGGTPEEFGLKVRSHPSALIVTARNKMGSSEEVVVNVALSNHFVETAILRWDMRSQELNRNAARRLAERLASAGHPISDARLVSGGWLLEGASVDPVMEFIAEFVNHRGSLPTYSGPVRRYIEERQKTELASWDILFASSRVDENTLVDYSLGIRINYQRRTAGQKSDASTLRIIKHRVSSRGIEKTGLTDTEIAKVEQHFRETAGIENGKALNYPDHIYRIKGRRPLLIVHLLKIDTDNISRESDKPVVAWSISFPKTGMDEKRVEYVVNTTWMRENFLVEGDEDEMGGDE